MLNIYWHQLRPTISHSQPYLLIKFIAFLLKDPNCLIVTLSGLNPPNLLTSFDLLKPTNGSVWLAEKEISNKSLSYRARNGLGYFPQESSIFRKMSVQDNILSAIESQNKYTKLEYEIAYKIHLENRAFVLRKKDAIKKRIKRRKAGGKTKRTKTNMS